MGKIVAERQKRYAGMYARGHEPDPRLTDGTIGFVFAFYSYTTRMVLVRTGSSIFCFRVVRVV